LLKVIFYHQFSKNKRPVLLNTTGQDLEEFHVNAFEIPELKGNEVQHIAAFIAEELLRATAVTG